MTKRRHPLNAANKRGRANRKRASRAGFETRAQGFEDPAFTGPDPQPWNSTPDAPPTRQKP